MGETENPIGSRRELALPTACAGEGTAHTTGNNLHHKRIIQDSLSIFKSLFYVLRVYEGKALCVAISSCLHGVFLFFSKASQRGPYPPLPAAGRYTFTRIGEG